MEKIDSILEISELIALERCGQLNSVERGKLGNWLNSSESNRILYSKIVDSENLKARNKFHESLNAENAWDRFSKGLIDKRVKRSLSKILAYAAAILFPLFSGISVYWFLNNKAVQPIVTISKIEPGAKHAVLIMDNGNNVNLIDESKKSLVEDDGTVIKNKNDVLSYAGQNQKQAKKTLINTLIVPKGGEYNLVLSDSTRVFVNSKSKLEFPVRFTGNKREVTLEGEAYFEVSKDKTRPFIVTIKGIQVEVLGTSFNVKAYPDDEVSYTTLVEGKVKLNGANKLTDECFLNPDQQAVYNPSTTGMLIQKIDAQQVIMWTKGRITFSNQTLDEIMKSLSRWYDFNYRYEEEALKMIKFEGGLNKYESINPIIDIIQRTGKVKVTIEGKEVLFSKIK